jgi:ABC-type nickel/cobalt efflux system permease component RcnA
MLQTLAIMKTLLAVLNPRSDDTPALVARGMLALTTILTSFKVNLATAREWLQIGSLLIGIVVGLATFVSICIGIRRQLRKDRVERDRLSTSSTSTLGAVAFFLLVSLGSAGSGCGLLSERERSESLKATEALSTQHDLTIRKTLEPSGLESFASRDDGVTSIPLREQVEITSRSTTDAGSKTNANGSTSTTIPFGVKLGLAGLGLILLAVGLKLLWGYVSKTALGQGLAAADELAARQIRKFREKAMTTTDTAEIAQLNAHIADLESERGRLASRK